MNDEPQPSGMHDGLPVAGYQPQSQGRVHIVNTNKETEERILRAIESQTKSGLLDPRWAAIARTGFESAFMALNRAVFQPSRVKLPEDAQEAQHREPRA